MSKHKNKIINCILYLLGFSLWFPNISIISIKDLWGLQIGLLLSIILSIRILLNLLSKFTKLTVINTFVDWIVTHFLLIISMITSTILSRVGLDISIITLGVESLGIIFSISVSWWLCCEVDFLKKFISGFNIAGFISAIYAIYQIFALKNDLPFAHLGLENPSFSTLDIASSQYLLRSSALTPEPSILASLLWILIGIKLADIIIYGGLNNYLFFGVILIGIISTSSQSIAILPIYILFIFLFSNHLIPRKRGFNNYDLLGIFALSVSAVIFLIFYSSYFTSLERIGSFEDNISFTMRSNEMILGLGMFMQSPFIGWGLGAIKVIIKDFQNSLGITMSADGLTSGFLRVLAEQGIVGFLSILFILIRITPLKINRQKSKESAALIVYQLSFIISSGISLLLFIGYRNLYHLWLILPIGLSLKTCIRKFN